MLSNDREASCSVLESIIGISPRSFVNMSQSALVSVHVLRRAGLWDPGVKYECYVRADSATLADIRNKLVEDGIMKDGDRFPSMTVSLYTDPRWKGSPSGSSTDLGAIRQRERPRREYFLSKVFLYMSDMYVQLKNSRLGTVSTLPMLQGLMTLVVVQWRISTSATFTGWIAKAAERTSSFRIQPARPLMRRACRPTPPFLWTPHLSAVVPRHL